MQTAVQSTGIFAELKNKIETKTARVGIVGLGYVGLPLAVEFANAGFSVTGIDVLQPKVDGLNRGESHVQDVPDSQVAKLIAAKRFSATTDFSIVRELDTINICVPTPCARPRSDMAISCRGGRNCQALPSRASGHP